MADIECDVLVVGSGIGGLTAAIAARMAGLKTILIEQSHRIGGNTARSTGMLWLPNNPLMVRARTPDSRAAALDYLDNFVSEHDPSSTVRRREAFVDGVAPLVALLEAQGIPLQRCAGFADYYDTLPGGNAEGRMVETPLFDIRRLPGNWARRLERTAGGLLTRGSEEVQLSRLRLSWRALLTIVRMELRTLRNNSTGKSLCGGGAALQGYQLLAALNLNADIRTNAALRELLVVNDRVRGARVDFDGWSRTVNARRGVIVSAGGLTGKLAIRHRYMGPSESGGESPVSSQGGGELLYNMMRLDAAFGWTDEMWPVLHHLMGNGSEGDRITAETHKPHVILVDRQGRRFVDEAADGVFVGRACRKVQQAEDSLPAVWAIMDSRHRRRYPFGRALPSFTPRSWLADGSMVREPTIAALARSCGIDEKGLAATVGRWNAMAALGKDEDFARGASAFDRLFGDPSHAPNPCIGRISRAPFYAVPLMAKDIGSCGGVLVDEFTRVRRGDGSPIEGLYAVGNCAAPLTGPHAVAAGQRGAIAAVFAMAAVRHIVS